LIDIVANTDSGGGVRSTLDVGLDFLSENSYGRESESDGSDDS
jgi:hypothetical protein